MNKPLFVTLSCAAMFLSSAAHADVRRYLIEESSTTDFRIVCTQAGKTIFEYSQARDVVRTEKDAQLIRIEYKQGYNGTVASYIDVSPQSTTCTIVKNGN